jgi:hypothetical protein
VSVEPGPLTILRAPDRMVLRRTTRSGALRGAARVLVADARGTGEGFALLASVDSATPAPRWSDNLTVRVRKVVVTAGGTDGVRATSARRIAPGDPTVLLRVAPRVGNGAFAVSLHIETRSPGRRVDRLAVVPRFEVG